VQRESNTVVLDGVLPPSPRTGVIERAFALLAAFDDRHRSLRLSELADRTGLPLNTTLRLARTLVELGALERHGRGHYIVGLRLFEIATLAPRAHGLRRTAMPYLGDLASVVGHHVMLTVRDGDKSVLVECLSARDAPAAAYRVGSRLPLDYTGAGLVLLAHSPQEVRARYERKRPPSTDHPALFPSSELPQRLATIRTTKSTAVNAGHPITMSTAASGVFVRQQIVAAVSVVAAGEDTDIGAVLPAVVTVAHAISRALCTEPFPLAQ
jgi:DNA-binding IclR family transcriptional regulator